MKENLHFVPKCLHIFLVLQGCKLRDPPMSVVKLLVSVFQRLEVTTLKNFHRISSCWELCGFRVGYSICDDMPWHRDTLSEFPVSLLSLVS